MEKKTITTEERIENLKQQQAQYKELFFKCSGAIEVLEQMLKEDATDAESNNIPEPGLDK